MLTRFQLVLLLTGLTLFGEISARRRKRWGGRDLIPTADEKGLGLKDKKAPEPVQSTDLVPLAKGRGQSTPSIKPDTTVVIENKKGCTFCTIQCCSHDKPHCNCDVSDSEHHKIRRRKPRHNRHVHCCHHVPHHTAVKRKTVVHHPTCRCHRQQRAADSVNHEIQHHKKHHPKRIVRCCHQEQRQEIAEDCDKSNCKHQEVKHKTAVQRRPVPCCHPVVHHRKITKLCDKSKCAQVIQRTTPDRRRIPCCHNEPAKETAEDCDDSCT